MPIFREHGSSFAEPEIYRVFPVEERADRADFLWITSKEKGVDARGADPL